MVGFAIRTYVWLFRFLIVKPLKWAFRALRREMRRSRQRQRMIEEYRRRTQEWH